jgi:taurine dioxygenase
MWDNRCTMHYAIHDYGDAERVLHRTTMEDETFE